MTSGGAMDRLHSYPKVYAIGHGAISDLFADNSVLVEEKVDGSQFSFSKTPDDLKFRSRGCVLYDENTEKMFAAAIHGVREVADRLHEGWVYRGEYLSKPKHNTLQYERVPRYNVILFDVNIGDEVYLPRDEKEAEAERIGMEIVPRLYEGPVKSPEQFYRLLEKPSILGGPIEGVVVKNYARFGLDKKVLMGKYVSESFKETHNKEWKADNPSISDVVDRIVATVRNENRWKKSVQRLRDEGKLENSPKDIGNLIKEIQVDVRAEEQEFIVKKLVEFAMPRILRASTGGFPEWYKKQLLESSFTDAAQ